MDANIPFIIKNTPYLWIDKNPSLGGLKEWNQKRFARIYLVSADQPLYQGFLFPPARCPRIAEFFRGQAQGIGPENYRRIRLNGERVKLGLEKNPKPYRCLFCKQIATWRCQRDHGVFAPRSGQIPVSAVYAMLNLPLNLLALNNLPILDSSTPVLIEASLKTLKQMFPPGINHKLIKMTNVGTYSVTHWHDTLAIVNHMRRFIKEDIKDLTLTDATAGLGGDTLCFAQQFKKVNAVELVPLHCLAISHNLSVYDKRETVNLICANYVDVVGLYEPWAGGEVTQNVIYFDPPWGGPRYKTRRSIVLKLDNVPLSQIVWHIVAHRLAQYIFIKAPKNADLTKFPFYKWEKIRNFQLVCIKIR